MPRIDSPWQSAIENHGKKSKIAIQLEIDQLLSEAQALSDKAERENRDFTTAEQKTWDDVMNFETGKITQLQHQLDACERDARCKEQLALQKRANRMSTTPFAGCTIEGNGNTPGPIPATPKSNKLKAFRGPNAERDAWLSGQWVKATLFGDETAAEKCAAAGWDIRATAIEANPTAGGYLTPTPLHEAIVNNRDAAGIARQLCRVVTMSADTEDVTKKTGTHTVYAPGEAGAISDSTQTWGQVTLNAKKRAILTYVSQELSDDAIISIMDDIADEMGNDLASQQDDEFINGDGTSTYFGVTGLKNAIGSAGVVTSDTGDSTWDLLDMDDFTAVLGKVQSKYWQDNRMTWLCSTQFYYGCMLRVMAESGGNAISSVERGAAAGRPMFLGHPVYFSSKCATATAVSTISAYFGNFHKGVLLGDRLGVRIAQSDQYAFNTDRLAIRATTRYDINCHELGDSSNAGAVVALKTAAS